MKIQTKIYFIVAVIAVLIVGFIVGYYTISLNQNSDWEEKEIEIGEFYSSQPAEIFWISGEIKEIAGKNIILGAVTPSFDPFGEPKTELKTIEIDDNTVFVKVVQKSQEEIIEETKTALETKRNNSGMEIPIIEPFKKEQEIPFFDLKTGDTIKAEAEENIKEKNEFIAKKITKFILLSASVQD